MIPIPQTLGRLTLDGPRDEKTKRYPYRCQCGNVVRKSLAAIRAAVHREERCMCSSCAGKLAA